MPLISLAVEKGGYVWEVVVVVDDEAVKSNIS